MTPGLTMTCDEFDRLFSAYLDGTLEPVTAAACATHVGQCDRCGTLSADVRAISAQARALPTLTPSRDLWHGIAARIEAPVVPLTAAPSRTRPGYSRSLRELAVASALVAVTAGTTYLAVRRTGGSDAASNALRPRRGAATQRATATQIVALPAAPSRDAAATTSPRAADGTRGAERSAGSPIAGYTVEIVRLRRALGERRGQLDPQTVGVIERNLRVIDAAIAESRRALARDPASRLLRDQLTTTLDQKVDLLRTAVLLPSRS